MSQDSSSIATTLYDDSASLAVFKSTVSLIISIIIGTVLIISAFYFLFQSFYYGNINAKVTSVNSIPLSESKNSSYNLGLTYSIDGIEYNNNLTSVTQYDVGDLININYKLSDPNSISDFLSGHYLSSILSAVALIIMGASYYSYYMTTHYKLYAAAEGAATVKNIIL